MNIEQKQIQDRMDRTETNLTQNKQSETTVNTIRRKAMTGAMPDDDEVKWMVRELAGALLFKAEVLTGWIEGDKVMLKQFGSEPAGTRIEVPAPGEHEITESEMPDQGHPPEAVVEGADKIKAILEGDNGTTAKAGN